MDNFCNEYSAITIQGALNVIQENLMLLKAPMRDETSKCEAW